MKLQNPMVGLKAGLKFCVDAVVYDRLSCESTYEKNVAFILHVPLPTAEKKSGFEVAEQMVAFLLNEGIRIKMKENDREHQDIYCVCCKKCPARAGVSWYPFDVGTWDGINLPIVMKGKDEHSTCPIRVMAWCGDTKCKVQLYDGLMEQAVAWNKTQKFTGGTPYCMVCGTLKDVARDQDTGVTHCDPCAPRRFQPTPARILKYINQSKRDTHELCLNTVEK